MRVTKQAAETSAGENSFRRGNFRRFLDKFHSNSKHSPRRNSIVSQDADHESVSSTAHTEVQAAPSGVEVLPVRSGAAAARAGVDFLPPMAIDNVIQMVDASQLAKSESVPVWSSRVKMTLDKVNCEPELQHLLIKLIKVYGFMSQEKKTLIDAWYRWTSRSSNS